MSVAGEWICTVNDILKTPPNLPTQEDKADVKDDSKRKGEIWVLDPATETLKAGRNGIPVAVTRGAHGDVWSVVDQKVTDNWQYFPALDIIQWYSAFNPNNTFLQVEWR